MKRFFSRRFRDIMQELAARPFVSGELGMDDPGLGRLFATLISEDRDRAENAAGAVSPSPTCLPTSRVRTALLRESWSEGERGHLSGCTYCRRNEQLVRSQSWHPSFVQLFRAARDLLEPTDEDTTYHLQKDACRRCARLATLLGADRLLARLVGDLRAGVANAANRLSRALATGTVATLTFSALPTGTSRYAFEDGQQALVVASADPSRIRLEIPPGPDPRPRMVRLLAGDTRIVHDTLLVPRLTGTLQQAEFLLNAPPSSSRIAIALYEVDPTLLTRDDTPAIQSAYQTAVKLDPLSFPVWQAWAKEALLRPDLDALLRPSLENLVRPDSGKFRA